MSTALCATIDQLRTAAQQYVNKGLGGVQDKGMMAERQRDVDGAFAFLLDDACAKFRRDSAPLPPILKPGEGLKSEGAYQQRPERIGG